MRRLWLTASAVTAALFVLAAFSAPAFAQEDDMPLLPIPIKFENLDLNGTWNFTTTQPTVAGQCPAGNPMSGTVTITQQGTAVTFRYTSGVRCSPAEVCSYTGTITPQEIDAEGDMLSNQFVVSNSVDVDDEGGNVSSAIRLTIYNNEFAAGEGVNNYVHPEGFECRWDMDLELTREANKEQ